MTKTTPREDIDLGPAMRAGFAAVLNRRSPQPSDAQETFAVFLLGAMPALGEEFARMADRIADAARPAHVDDRWIDPRERIAAGARSVAAVIRDVTQP